jgi:hypothetical protein
VHVDDEGELLSVRGQEVLVSLGLRLGERVCAREVVGARVTDEPHRCVAVTRVTMHLKPVILLILLCCVDFAERDSKVAVQVDSSIH